MRAEPHPFAQYVLLLLLFPVIVAVQGFYQWQRFWNEVSE